MECILKISYISAEKFHPQRIWDISDDNNFHNHSIILANANISTCYRILHSYNLRLHTSKKREISKIQDRKILHKRILCRDNFRYFLDYNNPSFDITENLSTKNKNTYKPLINSKFYKKGVKDIKKYFHAYSWCIPENRTINLEK